MTTDRLHRCGHDLDHYEAIEVNGLVRWADPVPVSQPNGNSKKGSEIESPLGNRVFSATSTTRQMSGSTSPDSVSEAGHLFRFAETLQAEGDYDRAITEYRRLLFYFPESDYRNEASKAIFFCYYQAQKHLEAIHWAQDMLTRGTDSSGDTELKFFVGAGYFRLGNFPLARNYLAEVISIGDGVLREKSHLLQGLAFANEARWEDARQSFASIESNSKFYDSARQCERISQEGKKLGRKSPAVAGILAIIPGLGYLYDGYEQTAFSACVVNGLFIWATVQAFRKDNESLGIMLSVLSFGWYAGNIYGSVLSAQRKNIKSKNDLLAKFDVGFNF